MRETKEKFEADLDKNIKGASTGVRTIFENLRPYRGGDEAFWRLHQLDILDKHKAIIPVGSAHQSVGITHLIPRPNNGDGTFESSGLLLFSCDQ